MLALFSSDSMKSLSIAVGCWQLLQWYTNAWVYFRFIFVGLILLRNLGFPSTKQKVVRNVFLSSARDKIISVLASSVQLSHWCTVSYPSERMVPSQLSHHHSGHRPRWPELPPKGLILGNLVKYLWCQVPMAGISQ